MSLFGIESEEDCRQKIDALLELHGRAERATTKEAVASLKAALKVYYDKGNSGKAKGEMSQVESSWFWPGVYEAFVKGPNLNDPSTWHDGLYEVQLNLSYYRPKP